MAVVVKDSALVEVAREVGCVELRVRRVPRTRVRKAVKAALGGGVEVWRLIRV